MIGGMGALVVISACKSSGLGGCR
uniref:Uncharacterized protein n=1 Tax=Arundo donax TaxID=35708 RepID=A0A0A8Y3U1_ARUDO